MIGYANYKKIFEEFKDATCINSGYIMRWKPCKPPYIKYSIRNAIVIWIRGRGRIIYISKDARI